MACKGTDLEMASAPAGEDEYEDYEREMDVLYENTNMVDPNGAMPKKPPVAPKPKYNSPKQEAEKICNEDSYLMPRKINMTKEKIPDKNEKTTDPSVPEVTFTNNTPCHCGRKCKIFAITLSIISALVLGGVVSFLVTYFMMKNDKEISVSVSFIIANKNATIAALLTPQNQDATVSIPLEQNEKHSRFTNMDLSYNTDVQLGQSIMWNNKMVYGRALARKINSNGDMTAITGMASRDASFMGDTTLILATSEMAQDFSVVHHVVSRVIDLISTCYIMSGQSAITKISFTSSIHFNMTSVFGYEDTTLGAYSTLTLRKQNIDLTGLRITSDHPISVIVTTEYVQDAKYPVYMETVYPTEMLGRKLYIPQFQSINATNTVDIKILAIEDDTSVKVSGPETVINTLKEGNYTEDRSKKPRSVTCSKSCSTVAFVQGSCKQNIQKGQAMVAIPSENLYLSGKVYFAVASDKARCPDLNLAIVVEKSAENKFVDLMLNGQEIDTTWKDFSDGRYMWASIQSIARGTNTLESKRLKFIAYLYGINCEHSCGSFAHVIDINLQNDI